ncbi:type II secretion system minor pseudopilin GspK [Pelomonas sp. P7]|uniref:Type II secretion system protein K n=1 Tax=Pelomonas caseinilytica TaxID=2906763 RepID=A0ABS8XED1_9BURK|nr:type II secretion system minor pseudopilin GspK [Pelomonas sp. P7]MCE4537595.1 type II secretion system minor pseudopilin GspK [Pelomonas sp. P7]
MSPRRTQRGAALLTAMIIVTLIASLAAGMVWQQYRAVQIEAADRARAQSAWILQGALDWARLILQEDARQNRSKAVDHLGEPWAVPLAEARLSTFLATDRTAATDDEGPDAFLSGTIEDAQARYNLRALVGGTQVPALEQRVLERLCSQVNAPPGTAAVIITGLRAAFPAPASGASAPASAPATLSESGPLQPAGLDQLAWLGLDADTLKRLEPYVVLLPKATPVNLNTAPREVIAALFDGVDLASAERLVQSRKAKPLQNTGDAAPFLPPNTEIGTGRASVDSSFFIVTGRLRLDERQLQQRSLIERQGLNMVVLARERINQLLDRGATP